MKTAIKNWKQLAAAWISHMDEGLVVHFENMQNFTRDELRKILKFLGIEEDPKRLNCTLKYPTGMFKRKAKKEIKLV